MNKPIHSIKWAELPDTYTFIQKEDVVRYDAEQDLTEEEKERVRNNLEIAEVVVEKDTEMSDTSTGMVENRVIKKYVDDMLAVIADSITGVVENTTFASISDGADNEPIAHMVTSFDDYTQDLNGYANPYPIGANRNLYPQTLLELGEYVNDSGAIATSTVVDLSSLISVTAGQTYTLSGTQAASSSSVKRISQYANGVFKSQTKTTISAAGRYSIQVTIGAGCDGVRFSIKKDDTDIQFEEGSTATDYVSGENYCPIIGTDSLSIHQRNANLWSDSYFTDTPTDALSLETNIESTFYGMYRGYIAKWDNYYQSRSTGYTLGRLLSLGRITIIATLGSGGTSNFTFRLHAAYSDGTTDYGSNQTLTGGSKAVRSRSSSSSKDCVGFFITTSNGETNASGRISDVCVKLYDGTTTYIAPNGHDYTVNLGGTVYGGTIDPSTGELNLTYIGITLGASTVFTASGGVYYCNSVASVQALSGVHGTCSHFQYVGTQSAASDMSTDLSIGINATNGAVYIKASSFATAADLNAYLTAEETAGCPVTIVYEPSSVHTVQLEKLNIVTVLGENHFWTSAGTINKLEYVVDTKTYIDSKFAALMALAST